MERDNFYMVLPSNTSSYSDTPNFISRYTIHLPKTLELDKQHWEVALVQINFPISWYIISGKKYYVDFFPRALYMNSNVEKRRRRVPRGNYRDMRELVDTLNDVKGDEVESYFKVTQTNKVSLVVAPYEHVALSPALAKVLGFTYGDKPLAIDSPPYMDATEDFLFSHNNSEWMISFKLEEEIPRTFVASTHSNLDGHVFNVYVYCNIVEPTLVGDTYVPLIDTIGVGDLQARYVSLKYETPHYLPLLTGNIQNIEIMLCDDTGEQIRFRWGRVIVKLHFRRR